MTIILTPTQIAAVRVLSTSGMTVAITGEDGSTLDAEAIARALSCDENARNCIDNPLLLASGCGMQGSTDDPVVVVGTGATGTDADLKEICGFLIDTPNWVDSGTLDIVAVFRMVHPADSIVPVFELQVADDYVSTPGAAAATRGQTPDTLGSWSAVATVYAARIDLSANDDRLWLHWQIKQCLRSAGSYSQTYKADMVWNDPSSVDYPCPSDCHLGTCAIDCSADRQFRLMFRHTNVGNHAYPGYLDLLSYEVNLFSPLPQGTVR